MSTVPHLDAFVRQHVRALSKSAGAAPPSPADCLRVAEVAPGSVAEHAGVAKGDLLFNIDGKPAARGSTKLYQTHVATRRYAFYSNDRSERITLVATGIEIGVKLEPTADAISATYADDPLDLDVLWRRGMWAELESLANRTVAKQRNHPALVFLGAARYELGREDEGYALTHEYLASYADKWVMCFGAVARYYEARECIAREDREGAIKLLRDAFEAEAYERVAELIAELTSVRVKKSESPWLGKRFPLSYRLPQLGGSREIALDAALAALAPHQVHLVCLLANYRGNGPYNDFMMRYRNTATFFKPFVHGLHVITMNPERRADRAHQFFGEDVVQKSGLALEILLEDGKVTEAVDPRGSPHIMVLDRDGTVMHAGELSTIDLWDVIARLPAPPPSALAPPPEAVASDAIKPPDVELPSRRTVIGVGLAAVVGVGLLCGIAGRSKKANDPYVESKRYIGSLDEVFVAVGGSSMRSLEAAFLKKGYGNVTADDFKPELEIATKKLGDREVRALVAHSRADKIGTSSPYMPMSVTQLLEAVKDHATAEALAIDHQIVDKTDAVRLLAELPRREPRPFKVLVNRYKNR